MNGKNFSHQTLFTAIFSTVRKKVQERISYLFLFSLFLSTLPPNPDPPMRSSLRRPAKLNYVFSSAPLLSSPLGNFSILNKNKFRSRILSFCGKSSQRSGGNRTLSGYFLLEERSESDFLFAALRRRASERISRRHLHMNFTGRGSK